MLKLETMPATLPPPDQPRELPAWMTAPSNDDDAREKEQIAEDTLTLIEFCDPEIMAELCASHNCAVSFPPFHAEGRALAVVPAAQVAQVKQTVSELGISVREGIK